MKNQTVFETLNEVFTIATPDFTNYELSAVLVGDAWSTQYFTVNHKENESCKVEVCHYLDTDSYEITVYNELDYADEAVEKWLKDMEKCLYEILAVLNADIQNEW